MSLPVLMKALRQLTYAEMVTVAGELNNQLSAKHALTKDAGALADILSKLNFPGAEAVATEEHKYLKQAFSRKRSIAVKYDKGFYVACETLPGSQVVGIDLRAAFPQMLDQIVTMQALQNMK